MAVAPDGRSAGVKPKGRVNRRALTVEARGRENLRKLLDRDRAAAGVALGGRVFAGASALAAPHDDRLPDGRCRRPRFR